MNSNDRVALLQRAYRLFNDRQIEDLLAMLTNDVEWPDVANGTVLHSKEAIRLYWQGQFAVGDPKVEPTAFVEVGGDLVAVVEQRIGQQRTTVFHRYTFADNLVCRMVAFINRDQAVAPQ